MPEFQKVFSTEDNFATFACPSCGKIKKMDVSRYKNHKKAVKLKYKCRHCQTITSFFLERRLHYRKTVNLKGTYEHKDKKGFMIILDLSLYGVKLKLYSIGSIAVGDRLNLEFTLDDGEFSKIKKEVIVKNIIGKNIGAKFASINHYGKFGNYIAFHF